MNGYPLLRKEGLFRSAAEKNENKRKEEKVAKAMDASFLEEIYSRHYKNVYNYISFRINNHSDTEELTSAVFEKAIRKSETYKSGISTAEAWLIGIAKNVVTDYLRTKKRREFDSLDVILDFASPWKDEQPEEVVVMNDDNRALISAMAQLQERERTVLSMKFATDLKNGEIAALMGLSESHVGVLAHRALKKLKEIMTREESRGSHEN